MSSQIITGDQIEAFLKDQERMRTLKEGWKEEEKKEKAEDNKLKKIFTEEQLKGFLLKKIREGVIPDYKRGEIISDSKKELLYRNGVSGPLFLGVLSKASKEEIKAFKKVFPILKKAEEELKQAHEDASSLRSKITQKELEQIKKAHDDLMYPKKGEPAPIVVKQKRKRITKEEKEEKKQEKIDKKKETISGDGLKATGIINTVKKVIYGRKDFPPSAKKVIEANKDAKITGVSLHRRVLPKIYHSILNILSKGETEKLIKESDKDKLFHTSVWLKLDNKNTILLEKNEVLGAKLNPKEAKDEETLDITAPESLTLRELIDNTKKTMGNKFATYSAKDNNCSDFIIELLKSNNLLSTPAHDFLFQNSKKILESVPALNKIVQLATDVAGRANVLIEGGEGLNKKISKPIKMGRMKKGSAEAKAFGAKMKALREAKKGKKPKKEIKEEMKGEGFFDDLVSKVRDTASNVASKVKDIAGSGVGSMSAENGGRGIAESLLNTKIATQEVKEKQGRGMKKSSAAAKAWGAKMKALREAKMKGKGSMFSSSSSRVNPEPESEDEEEKKPARKLAWDAYKKIRDRVRDDVFDGKSNAKIERLIQEKIDKLKLSQQKQNKKSRGRGMKDEESSSDEEDEEYEDELIKKTLEKEMKGKGLGCGMKNDASACYMLHPARQSQVTTNPNLGMGFRHHSHSHNLVQMPIQTHHIPEPPSRQPVSNIYGSGVAPRSRSYVTDPTLLG